jgi:hypothetical protein
MRYSSLFRRPRRRFAFPGMAPLIASLAFAPAASTLCHPSPIQRLTSSSPTYGISQSWGWAIAAAGDLLVAGFPHDNTLGEAAGGVSVFRRVAGAWVEEQFLLAADGDAGDWFGEAVAIHGDLIVVGAGDDEPFGDYSGSAYLFRFDGTSWVQEAKLLAGDGEIYDGFGGAVATDGEWVVVGAQNEDQAAQDAGAVYLFRREGGDWMQQTKLTPDDGHSQNLYGNAVAIDAGRIAVGAYWDDSLDDRAGSLYLYQYDGGSWNLQQEIFAGDGDRGDEFGAAVTIAGERIAVGAPSRDDAGYHAGAAYLFRFDGTSWVEEQKILPGDSSEFDEFGCSVAIDGATLLVGAKGDDSFGNNYSGSAYLFRFDGADWSEQEEFLLGDGLVGNSVALLGDLAFISEHGAAPHGAVHLLDLGCESCLALDLSDLVAGGVADATISGGTPGSAAITVYGFAPGETVAADVGGYCATFGIAGVTRGRVVGGFNQVFDANGEITFSRFIPPSARGRAVWVQSAMQGTCPEECRSNLVGGVVE